MQVGPEPESKGLRESHCGNPQPLHEVNGIRKFGKGRHPKGICGVIQIQAFEVVQGDIVI